MPVFGFITSGNRFLENEQARKQLTGMRKKTGGSGLSPLPQGVVATGEQAGWKGFWAAYLVPIVNSPANRFRHRSGSTGRPRSHLVN